VNLLINGKVVYTATGFSTKNAQGQAVMAPVSWDVSKFKGKKARIQIVDDWDKGWGHITADHFVLSSQPVVVAPPAPEEKLLALAAKLKVDDTHLIVPVSNQQGVKAYRLGIYAGDELVQEFNVKLPLAGGPFWEAAYPLGHFGLKGKTITVRPTDGKGVTEGHRMAFNLMRIGDDAPLATANDYAKPYRNQFHLTSRKGWNNDPNGMVYHDGQYHLYYQHNPFGIFWGNMHWGHFVSEDLIRWREEPIALYQLGVRDMKFSGGGFVDFNNSAGLGKNTLFVAYTSTGRGECLSYSKDGGLTFTELPENPVVEHKGRDPKIIWYEKDQKWVMVVYNNDPSDDVAAVAPADPTSRHIHANIDFYSSKDLRKWTHTGSFTDADRDAVFECPEFFELPIEGRSGASRWVLYGAQNRYFIGRFDGDKFVKESGPHGDSHGNFYAAQTFSDVPDGRRIQVGWVRGGGVYAKDFPAQITNQGFTLPHTMRLRETADGLRIFFNAVDEAESLRGETLVDAKSLTVDRASALLAKCEGELTEVLIEFEKAGAKVVKINGIDAGFEGKAARVYTDRTFNEVYIDGGRSYQVRVKPSDGFGSTETGIESGAGRVKKLKVYRLKSIW
jgi:fructan beta-fructosidase